MAPTDEQRAQRLVDFIAVEVTTCTHRDCNDVAIGTSLAAVSLCTKHLSELGDVARECLKRRIMKVLAGPPPVPYTDDGRAAIVKAAEDALMEAVKLVTDDG